MTKNTDSEVVRWFVTRASEDPFFLGSVLHEFSMMNLLDEEGIAAFLKCDVVALSDLSMCRSPVGESDTFADDVKRVATSVKCSPFRLAQAIREVEAVRALQMTSKSETSQSLLMAARDRRERKTGQDSDLADTEPSQNEVPDEEP